MKLFPDTRLLSIIGSILVLTASQTALADRDHHNRNSWTSNPAYRQGLNQHHDSRSYNNNHNDNRFRTNYRNHGNSYRYTPRHQHDNWSVSLNFGSPYYSGYSGSSWYGTSFYTGLGYGVSPYRYRSTVVVNQPTVVYVNDDSFISDRIVDNGDIERPVRSLLRDLQGNCYERNYDSQGNETRIQLPDSECQF